LNVAIGALGVPAGATLDSASGMTIIANGGLAVAGTGEFNAIGTNLGAIAASINDGQINAINSTLNFEGGLANNGSLNLINTTVHGAVNTQTSAMITVAGNATFNGPVSGGGNFAGGGTVVFHDIYSPGDSPAAVNIDGNVEFGSNASLHIEIGGLLPGDEFDRVNVTGAAALDGQLAISLIDAFAPAPGNAFEILRFGAASSGAFDDITGDYLGEGLFLDPIYASDGLTLLTTQAGVGDTDLDGDVDLVDLSNLAASYGGNNGSIDWIHGDFDKDDDVDLVDLSSLAGRYGAGSAQAYADFGALVPEPAGLALFGLAAADLRRGRRTRRIRFST
jgi:hypothetical protein